MARGRPPRSGKRHSVSAKGAYPGVVAEAAVAFNRPCGAWRGFPADSRATVFPVVFASAARPEPSGHYRIPHVMVGRIHSSAAGIVPVAKTPGAVSPGDAGAVTAYRRAGEARLYRPLVADRVPSVIERRLGRTGSTIVRVDTHESNNPPCLKPQSGDGAFYPKPWPIRLGQTRRIVPRYLPILRESAAFHPELTTDAKNCESHPSQTGFRSGMGAGSVGAIPGVRGTTDSRGRHPCRLRRSHRLIAARSIPCFDSYRVFAGRGKAEIARLSSSWRACAHHDRLHRWRINRSGYFGAHP